MSGARIWAPGPIVAEDDAAKSQIAWDQCIVALRHLLDAGQTDNMEPNRQAIQTALVWITFLRQLCPDKPPTCITREPSGGVIVERRVLDDDGTDDLCQYTFYNEGYAERTDYHNGVILDEEDLI